eukprot:GILK01013214.1.p1 GENE.GILK01013214.1~~GILK01013214.1.p1  ORF type:complete len:777 (-),score=39.28 GILK01013214.1:945-3200(-)
MPADYKLNHFTREEATERYRLDANRNLFKQISPVICCGTANDKKEEIRQYFHATFEVYEKVFECLSGDDAFTVRPVHKLRHPLIFYYGHTACFFINKLVVAGLTERINPRFEEMFAIGVDEMSWDDLNEAHYNWPTVEEVTEYRRLVRDRIDSLIKGGSFPLSLPLTFNQSTVNDGNAFWWVVVMGCEHERIHLETASVHVRELPMQYVKAEMSSFWTRCQDQSDRAPNNSMVEIQGGEVVLGRQDDSPVYGWDSDYSDNARVEVSPFKASKMLVSNAEFFSFIKDQGYQTQRYWDEEGWKWVQWKRPSHPWFWIKDDSIENEWGYTLRLQTEIIRMPWNWPVEVNHLESAAFCRWKSEVTGKTVRMPTESEWLLLFDRYVKQDQYSWTKAPGNVNLEHHRSSCPVDKYPQGPLYDIVGNTWQHTENAVYPYKGYKVQPFYDDFSMPTFDGRHACMKGGAWISTGNEATRDARFAFRRHFFQYIGIRYVEPSEATFDPTPCMGAKIGMDPEVESAAHFAYNKSICGVDNISVQIADYAKAAFLQHAKGLKPSRSLDLYCGAGRITYELTQLFGEAIGSDFTSRKLIPAFSMKEKGNTAYHVPTRPRGPLAKTEVRAADFSWAATRERAFFFQADPTNLHAHMSNFDLIVAMNVLENIHSPHIVPSHLLSRLNAGGVLIVASTYDWQPVCVPDRKVDNELFLPTNNPTEVLKSLVEAAGGRSVADPISLNAMFPTSESSGSLRTVTISTFVK